MVAIAVQAQKRKLRYPGYVTDHVVFIHKR